MHEQDPLPFEIGAFLGKAPEVTPDTHFHVGVSGGKDSSAALLYMIHESGIPRDRIVASFCDIENDHPLTIEHVRFLSKNVHPIEVIKPRLSFFDLAFEKHRFPGTKTRFCTEELKIHPSADFIQAIRYRVRPSPVIAVSGVRADESAERAGLAEWDYSGTLRCVSWRPLIRWNFDQVVAIHKRYGVPLNPLYAMGAHRVGCWPCIMSRKAEIRIIALRFPERIDEIRRWEQRFLSEHGRYSSFFPSATVPERFRSMPYHTADGRDVMVATIDDVVKWALSGKGAKGSWEDDDETAGGGCNSGFCE